MLTFFFTRAIIQKIFMRSKMKNTFLTTLILFLFISTILLAQTNNANQDYIKAMTASSPQQQVKLLKEYLVKYAGKRTQYGNFVYANLCIQPYAGKTAKEIIDYGEKALALDGLDDFTKSRVLINVSSVYSQRGQNLDKAKNYSLQIIQIAKTNKGKNPNATTPTQWDKFLGAAYYTHGRALEKLKDPRGALNSYINSYKILKNPEIAKNMKTVGKILYDFKYYRDAEKAFELPATTLKDFKSLAFYAKCLYKNKKKNEALKYFKQAYVKQTSGEIAFFIGIILVEKAKSDPSFSQEAIKYLLNASFLSAANSKKAMELAESLFFTSNKDLKYNEKVKELQKKSKKLEDATNSFNKKYEDKAEEDLSDAEMKEMKELLAKIESEKKAILKLEAEQKDTLAKFNKLIEETKQRLGIK